MRSIFGLLGMLIAVAVIGLLCRQQLAVMRKTTPVVTAPASANTGVTSRGPALTVKEQSQQMQQQYKQSLDSALQQKRPMPDEQ